MNAASSAAAVRVRTASKRLAAAADRRERLQSRILCFLDLLAGAPEAPLAPAVPGERLLESRRVEVGPQALGEKQLRIRKLPEQEVADSLLAPGADEQVRLGRIGHREILGKMLFGDAARDGAGLLAGKARQRLQDVPAPAVIRRDGQRQAAIVLGQALAGLDQRAHLEIEPARVPDDLEADFVAMELAHFAREGRHEQLHQQRDLLGRAAPVLGAERKQRQEPDAPLRARGHYAPYRLDAALVPRNARQVPAPRPAPVAIEDDGDVARHLAALRYLECGAQARPPGSYRHQLRFLLLQQLVDRRDVRIGELLHFVLRAALVVLGHFLLLERFLQRVVRIATQVPDRDARVLGLML